MTTTDIDSLHATLDADPSDQETRRVLADAYDDAGNAVMADGLRWMAERDRHPLRIAGEWEWVQERNERWARAFPSPSDLPAWIALGIGGRATEQYGSVVTSYPTRRAAEEALCRALAQAVKL
jgi:hypothetical protein